MPQLGLKTEIATNKKAKDHMSPFEVAQSLAMSRPWSQPSILVIPHVLVFHPSPKEILRQTLLLL